MPKITTFNTENSELFHESIGVSSVPMMDDTNFDMDRMGDAKAYIRNTNGSEVVERFVYSRDEVRSEVLAAMFYTKPGEVTEIIIREGDPRIVRGVKVDARLHRYITYLGPFGDEIKAMSEDYWRSNPEQRAEVMEHEWVWQWAEDAEQAIAQHDEKMEAYNANPDLDTY